MAASGVAAGVDRSARSTPFIFDCLRPMSAGPVSKEVARRSTRETAYPRTRPASPKAFDNSLKLTSLLYAGKNETDLPGRVGRHGGEGIIHRPKHLSACTQDSGDERQVQPQTFALRRDDTQGR